MLKRLAYAFGAPMRLLKAFFAFFTPVKYVLTYSDIEDERIYKLFFFAVYILQKDFKVKIDLPPALHGVTVITNKVRISEGFLTVKEGYVWDGASGAIDTEAFIRASTAHDALYYLLAYSHLPYTKENRKFADDIMLNLNIAGGMTRIRAYLTYYAVRMFGRNSARSKKRRNLIKGNM